MTTPNNNGGVPMSLSTSSNGLDTNTPPLPPPMQVGMSSSSSGLGFNPTPASMIPHHHQYQQHPNTYMMSSPSPHSSHTILPFGPTPTMASNQQSFPLISPISNPFPSIHTSIPPTHFLSGNVSQPSQSTTTIGLDKRRRNPSSKRSLEDEDEEDNQNNIEIDDSGDQEEPPTRAKPIELKLQHQQQQQQSKFVDNNAKGCNCKKTGCLKRYCECFQNNKRCTIKCRCQGCKNYHECPDLHRVLEKQTKSGTGLQNSNSTSQRKSQKRKTNPVSQTPSSSSNNNANQSRPPIGSPSILGGGVVMAHGSVSQFSPLTFTNPQIASSLHQNSLSCIYGEEKIVELCKKLVLAAIQQEQVFKDEWKQENNSAPKTPKSTRKEGNQQVDDFLLCDEDDMHQTTQPQSASNRKVYPKGFENALGISLNGRITSEFKHFLLSGVQTLKSQQQATETQNILNNSMSGIQFQ